MIRVAHSSARLTHPQRLSKVLLVTAALLAAAQLGFVVSTTAADASGREVAVVTGGSMEPAFSAGDAVVIRNDTNAPTIGDVITFRTPHGLVTHRVVGHTTANGRTQLTTQGDANNGADADLVETADVVGTVEASIPFGGRLMLFLSSPAGRAVTLVPLLLWLTVYETRRARRLWREHPHPASPAEQLA